MSSREVRRLKKYPRFLHTTSKVLGKSITLTDSYWYLYTYQEILIDQIYKFVSNNPRPFIIDCGSNIGLSVIYFKYLYPSAKIIAFEPDPIIFDVLQKNIQAFGFDEITLYQQAVWKDETRLNFLPDGSVGGKLSNEKIDGRTYQVKTIRLRDFLQKHVDFLKIDIEGAEHEVIQDCADYLGNVDYLFIEYHSDQKRQQSLQDMLLIIQEAGFRYHIKDANPIAHPFIAEERNPTFDLQLNIFAYRA